MAQVWTTKTNMTTARFSLGSADLGNDVIAFGGAIANPNPITGVNELWSYLSNSWSSKSSMPAVKQFMASASTTADYAFSFGGGVTGPGTQETTATFRYSLSGNSWSTRTSFSQKRDRFGGAGLSPISAIIVGGNTGSGSTAACELFNDSTNAWAATGSLNTSTDNTQACSIGSNAFKIGGSAAEKYDTVGGTWTAKTNMTTTSDRPAISEYAIGASLLAYGGNNGTYTANTELYNNLANSWSTEDSMNVARVSNGGSSSGPQGALSTGGYNGSVLNTNELFEDVNALTRNAIDSDIPIEVSKGGTGTTSFSNTYGIIVANSVGTAFTSILVGESGQVFKGGGSSTLPSFGTASTTSSMFQVVSADPSSPIAGQCWYNSTTDLYKAYNGVTASIKTFTVT